MVGSWRGRSEGAELEGENKRGGGVEGVEGWRGGGVEGWRGGRLLYRIGGVGGGGEQCGNVTLPHSSHPWSISGHHMCMHT